VPTTPPLLTRSPVTWLQKEDSQQIQRRREESIRPFDGFSYQVPPPLPRVDPKGRGVAVLRGRAHRLPPAPPMASRHDCRAAPRARGAQLRRVAPPRRAQRRRARDAVRDEPRRLAPALARNGEVILRLSPCTDRRAGPTSSPSSRTSVTSHFPSRAHSSRIASQVRSPSSSF
jgi:hypothetical protein